MWKHLNHSNIVPFKGVTFEPPQLVSEWMDNGELREYLRTNPEADLISLVSTFRHHSAPIRLQASSYPVIRRATSLTASFTFIHAM